jgi:hypothetical protein
MATTADDLMGEYGKLLTFERFGAPVVNGPAGTLAKRYATETSTANAIVLPASKGTIEAFDNRREALSLAGKRLRYLKIAAKRMTFEPMPGDEVCFDETSDDVSFDPVRWQVLGCTPVNPNGTPLVYGVGVVKL